MATRKKKRARGDILHIELPEDVSLDSLRSLAKANERTMRAQVGRMIREALEREATTVTA